MSGVSAGSSGVPEAALHAVDTYVSEAADLPALLRDGMATEQVLMARQCRRYAESGVAGRVWDGLQRVTVGFGYRPWPAVCWLALFWVCSRCSTRPQASMRRTSNPPNG